MTSTEYENFSLAVLQQELFLCVDFQCYWKNIEGYSGMSDLHSLGRSREFLKQSAEVCVKLLTN